MKNLKHIVWYFKRYKSKYAIAIIFLLISYILSPLPSKIVGDFIDTVTTNSLTWDSLYRFVILAAVIIVSHYLVQMTWHYFLFGHSFQSARDIRRRFVSKVLKQSPEFFLKNSSGSLMSKATTDVQAIETLTGYGIMAVLDATFFPLVVILLMGITVSWPMTIVSIIVMPTIIVVTKIIGKKLFEAFNRIQQAQDQISESVMENITSIRVIKGFSTQDVSQRKFDSAADNLYENRIKLTMVDSIFIPLTRIIPAITILIALIFGQYLMSQNQLSLGEMTSFFLYLNMLVWPMIAFGDLLNVVQEASTSIGRIQEIYSYEEDVKDDGKEEKYSANNEIKFENYGFKYPGADTNALSGINLKIKKGQTLGIVGKIGSGKTSLVKQLLRFYNVEEGAIYLDEKPIQDYSIKSIREKIGYVPQQHLLFSKSVYDNIAFGKDNASQEEVMDAIEFADFTKDLHTLPEGLETMIGEKGISISGGQKQRVSISRAFIKDPEILILDDSLSAVDSITEKKIIENIKNERSDKTTIIVAHRLSGVMHADNIIVLEDGRIVEQGTHDQLLENKAWYYQQYESQKNGGSDE